MSASGSAVWEQWRRQSYSRGSSPDSPSISRLSCSARAPKILGHVDHPGNLKNHAKLLRNPQSLGHCQELTSRIPDVPRAGHRSTEQDHRAIKRRVKAKQGFREFRAARRTIQGYETMHMIRKGQVRWVSGSDVRRQIQFINGPLEVAA